MYYLNWYNLNTCLCLAFKKESHNSWLNPLSSWAGRLHRKDVAQRTFFCSCRSCQNISIFYTVSLAHVPPGTLNQLWTDRAQWNSALPPFLLLLESCGRRRKDPAALNIDPSHFTSTSVPIKGILPWPFKARVQHLLTKLELLGKEGPSLSQLTKKTNREHAMKLSSVSTYQFSIQNLSSHLLCVHKNYFPQLFNFTLPWTDYKIRMYFHWKTG